MNPDVQVHAQFDPASSTLTYVVWDAKTHDAVVIDPVLDFDPATQMLSDSSLKKIVQFVDVMKLKVQWVLETHAHADHLSSGRQLKKLWPQAPWGMSNRMAEVFENFRKAFGWPKDVQLMNLGVGRWFGDGEEFTAGSLKVRAIQTPGHTPACLTYQIGENLFTGDAIFMPDSGTGRCDFPGGSASDLYESIWKKLYAYPDHFKVFVGHDYQPGQRPLRYQTTIGEQKSGNIHLKLSTAKADFVEFRTKRDASLTAPRLLNPSLDWNLGAHQVVKP